MKNEILNDLAIPQDLNCERAFLAALWLEPRLFTSVAIEITKDDFYLAAHKKIYDVLCRLITTKRPIDPITIKAELVTSGWLDEVGGIAYVASLLDSAVRTTSISEYARVLRDTRLRRELMRKAERLMVEAADMEQPVEDTVGTIEKGLKDVARARVNAEETDIASIVMERVTEQRLTSREFRGLKTGYRELDFLLAGLQQGEQTIIAARPSVGKTALALNIAEYSISHQKHVLLHTIEMSPEALIDRLICSMARVNFQDYRTGSLRKADLEKVFESTKRFLAVSEYLHIYGGTGITPLDLHIHAEMLKERDMLDIVIVDYIQIMKSHIKTESRVRELDDITRTLRNTARELKVHNIALSQLSRAPEQRTEHRPHLSDLRESGSIEQNADNVLFIYREEMYKPMDDNRGVAEIIVAKQRNGPTDSVMLIFLREFTRFESLAAGVEF